MEKNTVIKIPFTVWSYTTNTKLTGQSGNITVEVSQDGANYAAGSGSVAELVRADTVTASGDYVYTPTQAETNCSIIKVQPYCSTLNSTCTSFVGITQQMITQQNVADAGLLAPTSTTAAAGSQLNLLNDIEAISATTL